MKQVIRFVVGILLIVITSIIGLTNSIGLDAYLDVSTKQVDVSEGTNTSVEYYIDVAEAYDLDQFSRRIDLEYSTDGGDHWTNSGYFSYVTGGDEQPVFESWEGSFAEPASVTITIDEPGGIMDNTPDKQYIIRGRMVKDGIEYFTNEVEVRAIIGGCVENKRIQPDKNELWYLTSTMSPPAGFDETTTVHAYGFPAGQTLTWTVFSGSSSAKILDGATLKTTLVTTSYNITIKAIAPTPSTIPAGDVQISCTYTGGGGIVYYTPLIVVRTPNGVRRTGITDIPPGSANLRGYLSEHKYQLLDQFGNIIRLMPLNEDWDSGFTPHGGSNWLTIIGHPSESGTTSKKTGLFIDQLAVATDVTSASTLIPVLLNCAKANIKGSSYTLPTTSILAVDISGKYKAGSNTAHNNPSLSNNPGKDLVSKTWNFYNNLGRMAP